MRGEHAAAAAIGDEIYGSSPHARGTRLRARSPAARTGIIPACAGNTRFALSATACSPDHPRMRGEHETATLQLQGARGSSPHARGTPGCGADRAAWHRIIPACAGNTTGGRLTRLTTPDHPRMRGEHKYNAAAPWIAAGSSPHARGTRASRAGGDARRRIIPACAGNTATP